MFNEQVNYQQRTGDSVMAKTFLSNVFSFMAIGLAITALIAYVFGNNEAFIRLLISAEGGMSIFGYVAMFAPFLLVLAMNFGFQRMSYGVITLLFALFSVLMGVSLSFIFLIYTSASIFSTFLITSGMFGAMAIVGYTTKTDLTKFGSLLLMGLIGIIIASLVNMFMRSGTMDYIISFIGVLIFTGLTAYDVQKLKRIGEGQSFQGSMNKLVVIGALSLYLDFINLFLYLLRFFGNRK